MTSRLRSWITKRRTFTAAIVLAYEPDLKRWWKLRLSVQTGVSGWTFKIRPPLGLRIKRLLYGWRFTNWLIAKPWEVYPLWPSGWRYRNIYDSMTRGFRFPYSLWHTITFPHVHGEWEE